MKNLKLKDSIRYKKIYLYPKSCSNNKYNKEQSQKNIFINPTFEKIKKNEERISFKKNLFHHLKHINSKKFTSPNKGPFLETKKNINLKISYKNKYFKKLKIPKKQKIQITKKEIFLLKKKISYLLIF